MSIWGLIESRMKVLGAVNLISTFPPLANAMVISLYAADMREEAEARGWPSEVYELMKVIRERIGYEIISEVLSRLSSNNDFIENLGDMLFYDLADRRNLTVTVYNYISALEDIGYNLSPHTLCLHWDFVTRLIALTQSSSIRDLRALDVAFISKLEASYGSEPLESSENEYDNRYDIYVCSPRWFVNASVKSKIFRHLNRNLDDDVEKIKAMLLNILNSNKRMYSYLKIAYTRGARIAWEKRNIIRILPGHLESVEPLINIISEDSIPALNYSLKDIIGNAIERVEKELIQEACGDKSTVIVETIPLLYPESLKNVMVKLRTPEEVELVKVLAEKLSLKVEVSSSDCLKLGVA